MAGLSFLRSGRDVLMVFVTSVVIWLLETVKYWFVMHAFTFAVPFIGLMLMNGVVNLTTTLPSAPGYIGTFEVGATRARGAGRALQPGLRVHDRAARRALVPHHGPGRLLHAAGRDPLAGRGAAWHAISVVHRRAVP